MKAERQGWQVAAKARRSGNESNSATMECSRPSGRPAQPRGSDITFTGESSFSVTDCKPKAIVRRLNWIENKGNKAGKFIWNMASTYGLS